MQALAVCTLFLERLEHIDQPWRTMTAGTTSGMVA